MNSENMCTTENEMELIFDAVSVNESLARMAVAAFVTEKNPTLEEISDVKTAVSEAVTNAIIHGYENNERYQNKDVHNNKVFLRCKWEGSILKIEVEDKGVGISNVEQAMEPLFTTKPDQERSGMGFSFMEAFMDELEVESAVGEGTLIKMQKEIGYHPWICEEE